MSLPIKKSSSTFTWNIENVSLCELRKYQGFFSPPLKSKTLANTEWYLIFAPDAGGDGEQSVQVARRCTGKSNFSSLDYELAFLAVDGTVLQQLRIVDALKKELRVDENLSIQQSQIVGKKKINFMHHDILSVRFRIWTYSMESEYCVVRTILSKKKFYWNIKRLAKYQTKQKVLILPTLRFTIKLEEVVSCHGSFSLRLTIFTFNGKHEDFAHCKIYFMGVDEGNHSEHFDFFASSGQKLRFLILTNREHLFNDMLRLQLHFTFGINEIERQEPQMVSDSNQTGIVSVLSKEISEDLLQFYKSERFGDATLVADGIYFQVHKTILCGRSKVFSDLFSEKDQSGYIECLNQEQVIYIEDLQPDVLDGMLLYIYTDTFHAWQWDRAYRLYDAACNYGIEGLKNKCRSALMFELSVSNACQILDLADTHKDEDLLQCAWSFICEHDEIVGTKGWAILHKCKYSLATKLLCEIYLSKPI